MPTETPTRTAVPRGRERLDEIAAILLAGIVRMVAGEQGGGRSDSKCSDLGESSLDFTADPSVCRDRLDRDGELT